MLMDILMEKASALTHMLKLIIKFRIRQDPRSLSKQRMNQFSKPLSMIKMRNNSF